MSSINDIVRKIRENRILNEKKEYQDYSVDQLITLAQEGDQLAVETLINTHKDFISKMSSKYFLDTGDRDDVTQLATIAFWDAVMKWDHTGDFEAFAGMIIKRKMTDELRKDSREKVKIHTLANSIDDTINNDGEGGETTIGDTLASKEASPEEQYLGKEGARKIVSYMRDKFSDKEIDVVTLYIRGYKIPEIAEELNMKYKAVENTLMRIRNKLTDYLRARESKKVRESKIEFSDEEKRILESVIGKVQIQRALRESAVARMRESYENYTETQLERELDDIEYNVSEIADDMKDTPHNDRDDLLDGLDDLRSKLLAMEEYLTDEQHKKSEEILSTISSAEDIEYEGDEPPVDPYAERGLKRSDFY